LDRVRPPAWTAIPEHRAEQPSQLTPLGTWWANVLFRAAGAVAPVIGELAGADAKAARKAAFRLRSSEPQ
jgi:hypothetical protein